MNVKEFLALPNDSKVKTVGVALALCLGCSILVSGAAVALKPIQEQNKSLDKKKNILAIAGLNEAGKSIDEIFDSKVEARVVDLATGEYTTEVDPKTFDANAASADPKQNVVLTKEQDIASIKRRAKYATVYLVKEEGKLKKVILPVHGYGLWSTMYGFLALGPDVNTVVGFGFYSHGETPGLGGEVDNPNWKAQWPNKQIFDKDGKLAVELVKGGVNPSNPKAIHQVDGLSGATLTSDGVTRLLRYWLGDHAFGPYIQKLQNGGEA